MINRDEVRPFKIDGAKIVCRNFSGRAGRMNSEGDRNFCLLLSDEMADELKDIGWNIKQFQPKDPDELRPQAYIPVAVRYSQYRRPNIVLITGNKKSILTEDTVGMLDWAEILNCDVSINPKVWEVNGKTGIKAYVKDLYITIPEDDFADKYSNLQDSALDTISELPFDLETE